MSDIHPTAVVAPGAVLGDDVSIGPHAVVGEHVELGAGCVLHAHATVLGWTRLGAGNEVFPGAVIGAPPQDLKHRGEAVRLEIGARNRFREHVTVHPGTVAGGGVTTMGDDNLLMVGAHVAHDCVVGSGVVLANNVLLAGHIEVQDRAILNGGSACHHFTTIGRLAYVGGLTRITWDVPPFTIVEGHPARIRAANVIGMERSGLDPDDVRRLKRLVRDVWISGRTPAAEAIARAEAEHAQDPNVAELVAFFHAAAAGRQGRARERPRGD